MAAQRDSCPLCRGRIGGTVGDGLATARQLDVHLDGVCPWREDDATAERRDDERADREGQVRARRQEPRRRMTDGAASRLEASATSTRPD